MGESGERRRQEKRGREGEGIYPPLGRQKAESNGHFAKFSK
jgi:hypothetical protein